LPNTRTQYDRYLLFFAKQQKLPIQKQQSKTKYHTIANYTYLFGKSLPKKHFAKDYKKTKEKAPSSTQ
jgi:hypothetical protein